MNIEELIDIVKEKTDNAETAHELISYKIKQIPSDTIKIELPQKLEPILIELSKMDKVKSDAFLNYEIKPRFGLKKYEINGYSKIVDNFRKKESNSDRKTNIKTFPIANLEGLVDLVVQDGKPAFLIKEGNNLSVKFEVEIDGKIFVPPAKEKIPFMLPNAENVINFYEISKQVPDYDLNLFKDLFDYLKNVSELPSEAYYEFIAFWIMHTYFIFENFQYSPIICFFALPERGKSRTGKAIIYLSYRGIRVESLREAYIVRITESFGPSIFFDIRDAWKKALFNNSEDILLNRFEKDTKVPRVNNPDRGPFNDIDYYKVFGATIIATNVALDKILETRAVIINMPQSEKRFETDVKEIDLLPFKERLLAFRTKYMGEALPEVLKPADGRLGDILKPILQVIMLVNPESKNIFFGLINEIQNRKKLENLDSIEAQIIKVLINLEDKLFYGKLSVKEITDAVNEGRTEKYCISSNSIGKHLSAMSFDKARTSNGASAIIYDINKINKLADRYGILSSETSVSSETMADVTEVSEVSDDSMMLF